MSGLLLTEVKCTRDVWHILQDAYAPEFVHISLGMLHPELVGNSCFDQPAMLHHYCRLYIESSMFS